MQTIHAQAYGFVLSFVAGVAAAAVLRFTGNWRRARAPRVLVAIVADGVALAVIGGLVFLLLLLATWGQIRGYIFLGVVAGGSFFYLVLGPTIRPPRRGSRRRRARVSGQSRRIRMNREYR